MKLSFEKKPNRVLCSIDTKIGTMPISKFIDAKLKRTLKRGDYIRFLADNETDHATVDALRRGKGYSIGSVCRVLEGLGYEIHVVKK